MVFLILCKIFFTVSLQNEFNKRMKKITCDGGFKYIQLLQILRLLLMHNLRYHTQTINECDVKIEKKLKWNQLICLHCISQNSKQILR